MYSASKLHLALGESASVSGHTKKSLIGVTDNYWFAFLAQQSGIDEVNFHSPMHDTASE
jgi:hypothetical protein